jgi:nucleoid DNA-binding protein
MAANMTKSQVIRHLAEKLESNNKTAAAFLEHLVDLAVK